MNLRRLVSMAILATIAAAAADANDDLAAPAARVVRPTPAMPGAQAAQQAAQPAEAIDRGAATVDDPCRFAPPAGSKGEATVTRGFDDNGFPFVEETQPDGSIRRTEGGMVVFINPDGSRQAFAFQDAPAPTPPVVPGEVQLERQWLVQHNEDLRDLISKLVGNDVAAMQRFSQREQVTAGSELLAQIEYRTKIMRGLTTRR